jgi:two-component system chemotaxis response regulator CheY
MTFNFLIVDDSSVMRAMIARTLSLSGLPIGEIHEAGDGARGIEMAREHWVDLAFVDLNMPILGGEEMIDQLRADPTAPQMPIIVVSSDGSAVRHDRLRSKGVGFIQKPFAPEQLRDVVIQTLGITHVPSADSGVAAGDHSDF